MLEVGVPFIAAAEDRRGLLLLLLLLLVLFDDVGVDSEESFSFFWRVNACMNVGGVGVRCLRSACRKQAATTLLLILLLLLPPLRPQRTMI